MSSKYSKSPTEFYRMTEKELKTYIRNAGKTLRKQLDRLSESPFSSFSEKLDRWESESVFLRGRGFSTKGLTTPELIDTAQVINNVISVDESSASLRDIVNRDIFDEFIRGGLSSGESFELFFGDRSQLNTAIMWSKRNWNMIAELLSSTDIQYLQKEYATQPGKFYSEALKMASANASRIDSSEYNKWWSKVDKLKSWGKK